MSDKPEQKLQIGDWYYLPEQGKLMQSSVSGQAAEVTELDNLCQKVLNYFLDNAGVLVSREQLLNNVWGIKDVSDARITRVIRVLRVALKDDTRNPRYIETIPKRGFCFIAPVRVLPDSTELLPALPQRPVVKYYRLLLLGVILLITGVLWYMQHGTSETETGTVIPQWDYAPVTAVDGIEFYHHVSVDERYLVYSYARQQTDHVTVLMLQDLQTQSTVQLTSDSYSSFGAAFSPDGKQLAYQRLYNDNHCEIRLLTLTTTRNAVQDDSLLVECGNKSVSARLHWSPDGHYLVYPSMDENQKQMALMLYPLAGGQPEQLTIPPVSSFGDYTARFSRAGDKLAFLRASGNISQIWLLDFSTRATTMLAQINDSLPGNIDWDLTDSSIIYPTGQLSLERVYLDGSQHILAYTNNYANELQVTASGHIYASVGLYSKLNIMKMNNQLYNSLPHSEAVFSSNRNESLISVNPVSGGPVAVVSRRSGLPQIWFFYEDGRQLQLTRFDSSEQIKSLHFSSDGKQLLILVNNELWLLNEQHQLQKLLGGQNSALASAGWSQDGTSFYYAESHQGRWNIVKQALHQVIEPVLVRSNADLYFESRDTTYRVWRDSHTKAFYLERAGQAAELLPFSLPEQQVVFTMELRSGGIYYSYLQDDISYQLYYYDLELQQQRQVLTVDSLYQGRFSVSADEQYIYLPQFSLADIDIVVLPHALKVL